jgi:hypothetical protein
LTAHVRGPLVGATCRFYSARRGLSSGGSG